MYVRGYLQGSENGRVATIAPPGESANSDYLPLTKKIPVISRVRIG